MLDKLREVERRYEELGQMLSSPEIGAKPKELMRCTKEHKSLTPLVSAFRELQRVQDNIAGNKEILHAGEDKDLIELAKEELAELEDRKDELTEKIRILLLPKDPNDEKNIILEVRAGAGGDEAGIFCGDLFRMFTRYAEGRGWKMELLGASEASSGGYKEIIALVSGDGAYSRFKYESGVHRVQRVPATESQGRIHTSTVTVAVLPEAEEVDVVLNDKDLRIDVFRASGPGGQSVNTTDSAVRVTHLPTGITVSMQDEKSQIKNKEKALKVLRSRILEAEEAKANADRAADRLSQVGRGDRSEKVRTYNYPQSRVTDHRIGLTLHSLDAIMNGELDQVIDPLVQHYQAQLLGSSLS